MWLGVCFRVVVAAAGGCRCCMFCPISFFRGLNENTATARRYSRQVKRFSSAMRQQQTASIVTRFHIFGKLKVVSHDDFLSLYVIFEGLALGGVRRDDRLGNLRYSGGGPFVMTVFRSVSMLLSVESVSVGGVVCPVAHGSRVGVTASCSPLRELDTSDFSPVKWISSENFYSSDGGQDISLRI